MKRFIKCMGSKLRQAFIDVIQAIFVWILAGLFVFDAMAMLVMILLSILIVADTVLSWWLN